MKLVYLTANDAWVFTYYGNPFCLSGHDMFFDNSWDAIEAAKRLGMEVEITTGRVKRAESPRGWSVID